MKKISIIALTTLSMACSVEPVETCGCTLTRMEPRVVPHVNPKGDLVNTTVFVNEIELNLCLNSYEEADEQGIVYGLRNWREEPREYLYLLDCPGEPKTPHQ